MIGRNATTTDNQRIESKIKRTNGSNFDPDPIWSRCVGVLGWAHPKSGRKSRFGSMVYRALVFQQAPSMIFCIEYSRTKHNIRKLLLFLDLVIAISSKTHFAFQLLFCAKQLFQSKVARTLRIQEVPPSKKYLNLRAAGFNQIQID